MKIALIPIDNRPVCYQLPKQIVELNNENELLLPPREFLGSLTKSADTEKILSWLENDVTECDYIIMSLDTIAYGGLITSRRTEEKFEEIAERLNRLKEILNKKNAKVFAFSSVMRISNNNINEEEKVYWKDWGKKIFDWSYNFHFAKKNNDNEALGKQSCIGNKIPDEILQDYLNTRKRNFNINLIYLDWLKDGVLDFCVYSKDDCAAYGLNVMEAEQLTEKIQKETLSATIKTGADEIPITLIGRALVESNAKIKIFPKFTQPEGKDKISKYEDLSQEKSTLSQIELVGGVVCESEAEADFVLLVNNFKNEQGELVMDIFEKGFENDFELPEKPFAVADILNANGADNCFIETLFKKDWKNLIAFAAWNTTGNTLGSVLAFAVSTFFAKQNLNKEKFNQTLFTRLCDDWAYQANVRKTIKDKNSFSPDKAMNPFVKKINEKLNTDFSPKYSFPWSRHFEIEID